MNPSTDEQPVDEPGCVLVEIQYLAAALKKSRGMRIGTEQAYELDLPLASRHNPQIYAIGLATRTLLITCLKLYVDCVVCKKVKLYKPLSHVHIVSNTATLISC